MSLPRITEILEDKVSQKKPKPPNPIEQVVAELKRTNELLLIICDALGGKV
jgi:hypothetical protein